MTTNLVLITKRAEGEIELARYMGKRLDLAVALKLDDVPNKTELAFTVEDFRVHGNKILA